MACSRRLPAASSRAQCVLISREPMWALLWRPSGAHTAGNRPGFLGSLAQCELVSSAVVFAINGRSVLVLREKDLVNLGSAVLDRGDPTVPPVVAEAVNKNVPEILKTVAGCRMGDEGVTLYLKCKKLVSFYPTLRGRLLLADDGGLDFEPLGLKVGLLPVPMSWLGEVGIVRVVDPENTGIVVEECITERGQLRLLVRGLEEGADDG